MRQPRILMCPPDYYGIEYEINPWMSRSRGSSPERARFQWRRLHDTLAGLGATVELMTPQPGLPDLVFTANAGLVFGNRFFSSRFRHEVRTASRRTSTPGSPNTASRSSTCRRACSSRGPATPCSAARRCSPATASAATWPAISTWPACSAGKCCRWNWSIHISTIWIHAFARWRPARRSTTPRRSTCTAAKCWRRHVPRLIAAGEDEAKRFGCNAVVVGKTVVLNAGCGRLAADLHSAGYTPVAVELDEFLKSGGSAKCLTLRLDGEEAAVWE